MCQKRANEPINVPMCQRCASYSTWSANVPKSCHRAIFPTWRANRVPIFHFGGQIFKHSFYEILRESSILYYYIKKVLHYTSCHMEMQLCSRFANFKNIWAILENLSRETKNLNFGICKLSLRKNLLKSLTSFSMEHVRLTEQLFS